MARPCTCERTETCRLCWLYHNRADYRALWDGTAPVTLPPVDAPPQPVEPPSLLEQSASFLTAMARWLTAGSPRPTPEQRAERAVICQACPHRREDEPGKPWCGKCGCPHNAERFLFGLAEKPGKLDMATEQCPDNPPRWLALL